MLHGVLTLHVHEVGVFFGKITTLSTGLVVVFESVKYIFLWNSIYYIGKI